MNEDWIGEEVIDIDDPKIPEEIRQHGELFNYPWLVCH